MSRRAGFNKVAARRRSYVDVANVSETHPGNCRAPTIPMPWRPSPSPLLDSPPRCCVSPDHRWQDESYNTYITLAVMQAGFIVTAGGLLPQLLAFFEMPLASIWRASSAIMAIPIFCLSEQPPSGIGWPPMSPSRFTLGSSSTVPCRCC